MADHAQKHPYHLVDPSPWPAMGAFSSLVLAGGASSRFYPVNKVFADPTGTGRSLIQQTYDRVAGGADGIPADRFHVICGADFPLSRSRPHHAPGPWLTSN